MSGERRENSFALKCVFSLWQGAASQMPFGDEEVNVWRRRIGVGGMGMVANVVQKLGGL